jgi:hypothetical protein
MRRRSAVVFVSIAALALAAVAQADGGGPGAAATVGWDGVLAPGGTVRYVAVPAGNDTAVEAIRTSDGRVTSFGSVAGSFGIPLITADGTTGGVSANGKTLVLADATYSTPRTVSHFVSFYPKLLQSPTEFLLPGDFAFDALSPNGKTLYLIQHVSSTDLTRYIVRAYDLQLGRLLPGRIADRTQKSWVMKGYAMTRTTSADGRWAYTLYQNPGGYPFIHALDTVRGVAHCIGLPWHGSQNGFYNLRLTLRSHEQSLAVHWLSGRPWLRLDTRTWRVTADHGAGFPWLLASGGAAVALVLGLGLLQRRRRSGRELEEELRELLRVPEREVVV